MQNEYIDFWNNDLVPYWHRFRHLLSGNGHIHSSLAWQDFDIQPGEKVLDVGCGYGETSLEMGEMVTSTGSVTGIDCTSAFLQVAEYERILSQAHNVNYITGDAQSHQFASNSYDVAYSRHGIMFFENTVAALKNMHHALKPGGRLCLIVWGTIEQNPCWKLAKDVALEYLPPPPEDAASCGPGPFSMGDEQTTRAKLKSAGFEEIEIYKKIETPICMGHTNEEALAYQTQVGPAGEIVYMANEKGQQRLPYINEALINAMQPYKRDDGYYLPSTAWAIMARKSQEAVGGIG